MYTQYSGSIACACNWSCWLRAHAFFLRDCWEPVWSRNPAWPTGVRWIDQWEYDFEQHSQRSCNPICFPCPRSPWDPRYSGFPHLFHSRDRSDPGILFHIFCGVHLLACESKRSASESCYNVLAQVHPKVCQPVIFLIAKPNHFTCAFYFPARNSMIYYDSTLEPGQSVVVSGLGFIYICQFNVNIRIVGLSIWLLGISSFTTQKWYWALKLLEGSKQTVNILKFLPLH